MTAVLSAFDLRAAHGRVPVLHGVSFDLQPGEVVAVVGRNGTGKTSLLHALVGLLPATGGRVLLDGVDVTRQPPWLRARRGMAYAPQGREIFPLLTVRENLMIASREGAAELEPVLEAFPPLRPLLDRRGRSLSGGEQQLLIVARCLCTEPRVLLLDEPTMGLQPATVDLVTRLLRELHARRLGILLVEQNLEFAADLATRALVIDTGVIARQVSPAELRAGGSEMLCATPRR